MCFLIKSVLVFVIVDSVLSLRLNAVQSVHKTDVQNEGTFSKVNEMNSALLGETETSALDNSCRSYGNHLASFSFPGDQFVEINSAGISLVHDIFDLSFGLVPAVSYKVHVEGTVGKEEYPVYALQVNYGKMTSESIVLSSFLTCDHSNATGVLLLTTTSRSNWTWIAHDAPGEATSIQFRLFGYVTETQTFVKLAGREWTLLSGCFLKLRSLNGVVASTDLSLPNRRSNRLGQPLATNCSLLLNVPYGSSAEITLKKLKLPRKRTGDCTDEGPLLLWASSTSFTPNTQSVNVNSTSNRLDNLSDWPALIERESWSVARRFCGKIQDYQQEMRVWRSFDSWILIRYLYKQHTEANLHDGFSIEVSSLGPCSNQVLTDLSKTIEISDTELVVAPECGFRIHLPYGYRVQLTVGYSSSNEDPPFYENADWNDTTTKNASLNKCHVAVQMEDVTGKRRKCLRLQQSTTFTSLSNILQFQAAALLPALRENFVDDSRNPDKFQPAFAVNRSIRVRYISVADPDLTKGCSRGLAAEETCIWLVHEPLSWYEAEARCKHLAAGGHLVAITSPSIQMTLDAIITNSAQFRPNKSYWTGGSDFKQETVFEWSTGDPFTYTRWFPGWPTFESYNSQPSDDGLSDQDCIEVRRNFGQPGQADAVASGLYWNDRDCSVANPFVCQHVRQTDFALKNAEPINAHACNRTEYLHRSQTTAVVHSPLFPQTYQAATTCTTDVVAPSGFRIVINFDHFDLEEDDDCNYDWLELHDTANADANRTRPIWRRCGNWNSRLKLLRWTSIGSQVHIAFRSDNSYEKSGFRLIVTLERTVVNCPEAGAILRDNHCYVIVPFPEVTFAEASGACRNYQVNSIPFTGLAQPESDAELNYLLELLGSDEQFNSTAFYWIGGELNQLQLSASQSARTTDGCRSIRPRSVESSTSIEPCSSPGGFICEQLMGREGTDYGVARNTSIESREGEVKSPNYPAPYGDSKIHRLHIRVANMSAAPERLVLRFKHVDVEFQEDCLYDYIGLQSKEDGPITTICGHHTSNLERLDYISDSHELWLTFKSDFSISGSGFHAVWHTIQLPGCPQKTFYEEGELFSPNFPNSYLSNLKCSYDIIAPEDHRVWIKFHVLEVGEHHVGHLSCRDDYVRLSWETENSTANVTLCRLPSFFKWDQNMEWTTEKNALSVEMMSVRGRLGRGFHATYRFLPIPTQLNGTTLLEGSEEVDIVPFNYPQPLPSRLSRRQTFVTRHMHFLQLKAADWLELCNEQFEASVIVFDAYNNEGVIRLCPRVYRNGSPTDNVHYNSTFHTLRIVYRQSNVAAPSPIIGKIRSLPDPDYAKKAALWPGASAVDSCEHQPCQNGGTCTTSDDKHWCQCKGEWKGMFCSLKLCQMLSPCEHGSCVMSNDSQRCNCDAGFTGESCSSRITPCDMEPCGDRGKCVTTGEESFICQCYPWWLGSRCEQRWHHVPFKPLSQRMLEEPFWLGLLTISTVLAVIGVVWCLKRHLANKGDIFTSDRIGIGKRVEPPTHGCSRSKLVGQSVSMEMNNSISRSSSPQSYLTVQTQIPSGSGVQQQQLLGWQSFIRKSSLLSITSLISPNHCNTNATASGATVEAKEDHGARNPRKGRTFSLDDLFRFNRARSPSPCKRSSDNDVTEYQRELERQRILQRLIATQIPGNGGNVTPRTGETLQMTPLGGRHLLIVENQSDETINELRAEKKVTFARMMEMVKLEMSGSETDTSTGDDIAKFRQPGLMMSEPCGGSVKRKLRGVSSSRRFGHPNHPSHQASGDHQVHAQHSSTTIQERSSPTEPRLCGNASSIISRNFRPPPMALRHQTPITESLTNVVRNLSSSHLKTPSTPSSPRSDYELSSSFPTPLSTPGSAAGSLEVLTHLSNSTDSTTIQVTVVDSSSGQRSVSRSSSVNLGTPHITLEIPPSGNYGPFLSPIHEVPTPLPSPSHAALPPALRRRDVSSTASVIGETENEGQGGHQSGKEALPGNPLIRIDSPDGNRASQHCNKPAATSPSSPLPSPVKTKPAPLQIANSNFARFENLTASCCERDGLERTQLPEALPVLYVSDTATESGRRDVVIGDDHPPLTYSNAKSKDWKGVNIDSPPIRKPSIGVKLEQGAEAGGGDPPDNVTPTGFPREKTLSCSLLLSYPTPMITVTPHFLAEESDDSESGHSGGRVAGLKSNMCYLSPFNVVRSYMAASDTNLSSSGYSSTSPGPSPSTSSKTICILDEHIGLRNTRWQNRPTIHRTVGERETEDSFDQVQRARQVLPMPFRLQHQDSNDEIVEDMESFVVNELASTSDEDAHFEDDRSKSDVADSTANTELEYSNWTRLFEPSLSRSTNVSERRVKGNSLDSTPLEQPRGKVHIAQNPRTTKTMLIHQSRLCNKFSPFGLALKCDGLDIKGTSPKTKTPTSTQPPPLQTPLQLPDSSLSWALRSSEVGIGGDNGTLNSEKKTSPVSSTSESPLSDAKSARFGPISVRFYGSTRTDLPLSYSDSDGLYDYLSSETVLTAVHMRRHVRKGNRRRERQSNQRESGRSRSKNLFDKADDQRFLVDPCVQQGRRKRRLHTAKRLAGGLSSSAISAGSSSNDSLTEPRRKCTRSRGDSSRHQLLDTRAASSPVCDVIVTVHPASPPECSPNEKVTDTTVAQQLDKQTPPEQMAVSLRLSSLQNRCAVQAPRRKPESRIKRRVLRVRGASLPSKTLDQRASVRLPSSNVDDTDSSQ